MIPISFDEDAVTWKVRKAGTPWTYAGGDVANLVPATARASGTSGSTVTSPSASGVQLRGSSPGT